MQSAVTAYSGLIFDIHSDSTLTQLIDAVNVLFEGIREDPDTPTKLVDTNRHLAWIKVIKV